MFLYVVFVLLNLSCAKAEEPRCSKYDFEEKVLEKLIRMEFQMEIMKSEVAKSIENIENIRKDVDDSMKAIEKTMTETLNGKLQELEAIAEKSITPTVAFKARLASSIGVTDGQTIVFPVILFNEGDAYNSESGIFTSPANGTYMFDILFCVHNDKYLNVGIMVDGTKYTVVQLYGDVGSTCHSADTVVVLADGQRVWIQVLPSTSSGTLIQQDTYRWNTFSGALIHK